jgi:L-ascorbate metabolism protein UlaG (beta-lactamase superfamily)
MRLTRRRALGALGLAGLLGAGGCAVRREGVNPYYAGPVSDHFDGTRFFNPGGTPLNGFGAFLRWQRTRDKAPWPEAVPVTQARPLARVDDLRVTMVGHATLLIQVAGLNLLTDPVWSRRVSPVSFAGPARVTAPGIPFDALPPIDAVLLSHNHYDHLDAETLRRLHGAHGCPVITPLGNDAILREAVPGIDARAGDWGDAFALGPARVTLIPCHHWSARGTRDRSMALWAAFVVETARGRLHLIGDTGFDGGRPFEVARAFGPIRLQVTPIGAYAPRWFMAPQHQDPAQAVEGFRISGAAHAVGHHWGTFQLTDEARGDPPARLADALRAAGIAPDRFRALAPGEAWDIPA